MSCANGPSGSCGSRCRQRLPPQAVIKEHRLDPAAALETLMVLAVEEYRRNFYAVLTGFRRYSPAELAALWERGDRYWPEQWLEQWRQTLPAVQAAAA